jgi:hypothetical protein
VVHFDSLFRVRECPSLSLCVCFFQVRVCPGSIYFNHQNCLISASEPDGRSVTTPCRTASLAHSQLLEGSDVASREGTSTGLVPQPVTGAMRCALFFVPLRLGSTTRSVAVWLFLFQQAQAHAFKRKRMRSSACVQAQAHAFKRKRMRSSACVQAQAHAFKRMRSSACVQAHAFKPCCGLPHETC